MRKMRREIDLQKKKEEEDDLKEQRKFKEGDSMNWYTQSRNEKAYSTDYRGEG